MIHNEVKLCPPNHGTHSFDTLPEGTYFNGFRNDGTPHLLKIKGGYVSLINGHTERDSYFVGRKVWPVQPGSRIIIDVPEEKSKMAKCEIKYESPSFILTLSKEEALYLRSLTGSISSAGAGSRTREYNDSIFDEIDDRLKCDEIPLPPTYKTVTLEDKE